jgi:glycosyltransferase involved in cell wall biosynthesis
MVVVGPEGMTGGDGGSANPRERSLQACYLGTFDMTKPRNRIMIRSLRAVGGEVTEIHRDVWSGVEDKSQSGGMLSALKYLLLLLGGNFSTSLRYLRRRPPGAIVVAYFGHLDLLFAKLWSLLLGRPLVFDIFISIYDTVVLDRRMFAPDSLSARWIRGVEGLVLKLPDAIICDTRANCAFLHRLYRVPEQRLWAVPVGCESAFFHPPEGALEKPDGGGPLEVLFYGQYIPLHGIAYILDAVELMRDDPGIRFTLIGRGQEFPGIRARVERLGPPNLTLVEWLPYPELRQRIYRAHIGLGIFGVTDKARRVVPNKVYQMMACGTTPIVTGRTPGIAELLTDGVDAILCDCGSGAAIAAAIQRLRDPALRGRIAEKARITFERSASYEVIGRAFGQALARAAENRRKASLEPDG